MPKRKDTKEKKVYFKPVDWEIVCKRAKAVNMKTGTYIREIAVRGEIKHYDMVQLNNLRMSFNRISYEFNQIAKVANSSQSIYRKDIEDIMGILGPGVIGLGSLVAVVGGIQTGVGFKDDNADGKTRGFQTLIGGAIIAAVGALVPSTISLGG